MFLDNSDFVYLQLHNKFFQAEILKKLSKNLHCTKERFTKHDKFQRKSLDNIGKLFFEKVFKFSSGNVLFTSNIFHKSKFTDRTFQDFIFLTFQFLSSDKLAIGFFLHGHCGILLFL